jgi:hypothetical protein
MVCARSLVLSSVMTVVSRRHSYGHSPDLEIETIETHRFQF